MLALEILLAVESERRTEAWFSGDLAADTERGEVTRRLVERGLLLSSPAPRYFVLSEAGQKTLANIRAKIAPGGKVNWTRIDEVDFPLL